MSYVSRVTTSENRTRYLASINGLNLLGIVMGPAVNVMVKSINWKPFGNHGGPQLNEKTNPGFFMVVILFLELTVCLLVFREPESKMENGSSSTTSGNEEKNGSWHDRAMSDIRRMVSRGAYVSYALSFANNFTLAYFETSLPVFTKRSFGWGVVENSLMYMSIGLSVAIDIVIMIVLSKRGVQDRVFLLCGHICIGLGLILSLFFISGRTFGLVPFIISFGFFIFPLPFVGNPNVSLYTKHIDDEGLTSRTGFFMGVLLGIGGVCRSLGPVWAGYTLEFSKNYLGLSGPLIFWFLALCLLLSHSKYLQGPVKKIESTEEEEEEEGGSGLSDPLLSHSTVVE